MKSLVQKIIRLRNPNFTFDESLDSNLLFAFVGLQAWSLFRGLKCFFYFKNPKMAMFGSGVKFFNAQKIQFGRFLKLGDNVFISGLGKEGVKLGDNVGIGAYSRVVVSTSINFLGSYIQVGNNVGIGEFAYLGGAGGLKIGDDCIVGQYFSCHPENHLFDDPQLLIRLQGVSRKGIEVGSNCWIGSKVTILDGVKIGNNCVIAAGAVVNKSFPDGSVIGGVPAKSLK